MKTTFGRLFTVTALTLLVSVVFMGLSFWGMVRGYLSHQRQEELSANATAVAELASDYATAYMLGLYSGPMATELNLNMNISFAARVSGIDVLLCDREGVVECCSCREPVCVHVGQALEDAYVRDILTAGQDSRTAELPGIYEESRYCVAMPYLVSDYVRGLVVVSQPSQETNSLLSQITELFCLVALVALMLTVIVISIFTRTQTNPLKTVAETARQFGHGDLKARVRFESPTTQEIDELAVAFNNMASGIEKSEYQRQEFVANVSHELKTPMTTIGGYVDGILDGTIPKEHSRKYLTLVSDEIKRLSRLVRSMLDISRLQDQTLPQEKMSRFDVAECVGQVLITFEQKINQKALDVQVDFPEYAVYARAALDAITQVVYNLIDNAVKFCPQGGQLGVVIREGGSKVYVSVSNTGETIPPGELPLVFDRFHKLDKSRSQNRDGWGLGLYIVKTIICSHGQDISVTSRDGRTEFTFTLEEVNSL